MARRKRACAVCGTSQTKRRKKAEITALDAALYALARDNRPVTVRQMFYQAVVRGLVPKCEAHGYGPVQRRLLALREEEIIPYGWITDNARMVRRRPRWNDPDGFLKDVAGRYRRDYWSESDERVESWLEKDALAGVLYPVVIDEFGLELYVTRGFASVTYLQEAADDIRRDGRKTHVYLMTDFDPSGLSIASTVAAELTRRSLPVEVSVERIAVDREQIDEYGLPTRPTKHTDSRARKFVEEHGTGSVELDAIPPDTLRSLVRQSIERHMEPHRLAQLKMVEEQERRGLAQLMDSMS